MTEDARIDASNRHAPWAGALGKCTKALDNCAESPPESPSQHQARSRWMRGTATACDGEAEDMREPTRQPLQTSRADDTRTLECQKAQMNGWRYV